MLYEWPGNMRELTNVIERAITLLPIVSLPRTCCFLVADSPRSACRLGSLKEAREQFERMYIIQVLTTTKGNVSQAAVLSGNTGLTSISSYESMPSLQGISSTTSQPYKTGNTAVLTSRYRVALVCSSGRELPGRTYPCTTACRRWRPLALVCPFPARSLRVSTDACLAVLSRPSSPAFCG